VGGSLSGLSTAITIKKCDKHIKVIVHEKNKEIGYNREGRRCGEGYCLYTEVNQWRPCGKSIYNVIKKQVFVVGEKTYEMPTPSVTSSVVVLNRQEFIAQLGRTAANQGVDIQIDDRIKSIDSLEGDYIVDASGCPSMIRQELGFKTRRYGICYQQTLEDSNIFSSDTMKFFFFGSIGYYWIFPRNPQKKEINLGVGIPNTQPCHLKKMLETFKEEQNIEGTINYVTGGLVPTGLQRPLMHKNIVFVGDAGVGAFPVTGEGIPGALLSGEIAGRCIATGKVKQYPYRIRCATIKWDLAGKVFVKTGSLLQKIGTNAYVKTLDYFLRYFYFPMAY
jgi:flavin-dependent dehydrogenase